MKRWTPLLSVVGLACAADVPPTIEFLLRNEPAGWSGVVETPGRIVIARVSVSPYLRRNGIVVETAPGQIRAAAHHRWAEPLDAALEDLLRVRILRAIDHESTRGTADRGLVDLRISIEIDRLHGTIDGLAMLEARYRIETASGEVDDYLFSRSRELTEGDYHGLVAAERILAEELAEAIADSINGRIRARVDLGPDEIARP